MQFEGEVQVCPGVPQQYGKYEGRMTRLDSSSSANSPIATTAGSDGVTHASLVALAVRWLKKTRRCSVVLAEPFAIHGQSPDAIGWAGGYFSTMVECKVSRSDFKADQKKHGRVTGYRMARRCYYLTPPGLVSLDELPPLWGLLEAHGNAVRVVQKVPLEEFIDPRTVDDVRLEMMFLWAELRRYHARGITYPTMTGKVAQPHLLPAAGRVADAGPAGDVPSAAEALSPAFLHSSNDWWHFPGGQPA